ncbi:transposable element Tcb2 transposase [Trichonephila clavipes]|nr:transposable element Tcb2 transposase [Trichonephila clavipes]
MSQRRRLPNSLRWRAVGWMEMGLSQADAARRLNVVQRLWDQYQSEDSVSRRPVPGRPRATTPAEDRFLALSARRRRTTTVPQLVADHFQASGRRIFATTVRNRLHNAGLYARRPVVCVPLNGRQRRNRLCWAREHVSWTQQQWASVLFTDDYRGGGILVWAGISLGGHTDLHVFHGGTVTGLRYRDEILDPYVRPYAAAIGNDFILMDDNARPHRARIVEEYLEDHGLERMEWPARSPDLNLIEHRTILAERKLTVWCALWAGGFIGPYFFKNDESLNVTVNGDRYRAMITNFFIPDLNNHDVHELWFQQDGATCHTARATIDLLKDTFGDRLISRFGPVNWPPRSCDLTPLDYFLWGYVKSLVYADKPQTLDHLKTTFAVLLPIYGHK